MALRIYSGDNAENYPTGGSTPEESLSLLSRGSYLGSLEDSADILRGKTVPLEVALKALHENGKLGPDTCGWHYTEGLTDQDDPQIAVVWDKIGLGHNGERWSEAGHEVGLIDGSERFVTAKEWPAFLEHQRALLAARTNSPRGVGQSNANAAQSGSRVGSSK